MIKAVSARTTLRAPALDSSVSYNDPAGFINGLSKRYLFILEDSPEIFQPLATYYCRCLCLKLRLVWLYQGRQQLQILTAFDNLNKKYNPLICLDSIWSMAKHALLRIHLDKVCLLWDIAKNPFAGSQEMLWVTRACHTDAIAAI